VVVVDFGFVSCLTRAVYRATGVAWQHTTEGYVETDFVVKARNSNWGADLDTPHNTPLSSYLQPQSQPSPQKLSSRVSKGDESESGSKGTEGEYESTTHSVAECLPQLYALFARTPSALLPLQTSGLIKR
jgi:hypothetical protein